MNIHKSKIIILMSLCMTMKVQPQRTVYFDNQTGYNVDSILFDNIDNKGHPWQKEKNFAPAIVLDGEFSQAQQFQFPLTMIKATCDPSCCNQTKSEWYPINHATFILTNKNGKPQARPEASTKNTIQTDDQGNRIISFINKTGQPLSEIIFDNVTLPDQTQTTASSEAPKRFRKKGKLITLKNNKTGSIVLNAEFVKSKKFSFQLYPISCKKPGCCTIIESIWYPLQDNTLHILKIKKGKPIAIPAPLDQK